MRNELLENIDWAVDTIRNQDKFGLDELEACKARERRAKGVLIDVKKHIIKLMNEIDNKKSAISVYRKALDEFDNDDNWTVRYKYKDTETFTRCGADRVFIGKYDPRVFATKALSLQPLPNTKYGEQLELTHFYTQNFTSNNERVNDASSERRKDLIEISNLLKSNVNNPEICLALDKIEILLNTKDENFSKIVDLFNDSQRKINMLELEIERQKKSIK